MRLCRAILAAVVSIIGPDEIMLATALLLVSAGFWTVWRPASYLVPGLVLLWIALPQRASFVLRQAPRLHDVPQQRKRTA